MVVLQRDRMHLHVANRLRGVEVALVSAHMTRVNRCLRSRAHSHLANRMRAHCATHVVERSMCRLWAQGLSLKAAIQSADTKHSPPSSLAVVRRCGRIAVCSGSARLDHSTDEQPPCVGDPEKKKTSMKGVVALVLADYNAAGARGDSQPTLRI